MPLWRALGLVLCVGAGAAVGVAEAHDNRLEALQLATRSWNVADGLPQATVTGIAQTPDGYLWVSTFGGLARFDGLQFHPVGAEEGLPPRIAGLQLGHDGTLWVLPETGGLWRRDPSTGVLAEVPELSQFVVRGVAPDADGSLWAGTAKHGLVHLARGTVTALTTADGLPSDIVGAVTDAGGGAYWVGTDLGLAKICGGRPCDFPGQEKLAGRMVVELLVRRDGSLVLGSDDNMLCTWREGAVECERVADRTVSAFIAGAVEDADGALWVPTTGGLFRLRDGGETLRLTETDGLSDTNVTAAYFDADGNLWVGANAGGLNLLRKTPFQVFGRETGLQAEQILAVAVDSDGAPLVTLNCGPVTRIVAGRAEPLDPRNPDLDSCGWSVLRARDGALWFGTWGQGLVRVKGGESRRLRARDGLGEDVVVALFERRSGEVWAGTRGGGACRVDTMQPSCLTTHDGLAHDDVRYFAETPDGALWIATSGGLSRWDGSRFDSLTTRDGLMSPLARSLHVDSGGELWVGTYGGGLGLVRGGRVLSVTSRAGLLDDVVSWIGEADDGTFWLTGNRGIFRVLRADLVEVAEGRQARLYPSAFGIEDGLRSQECAGGFQPAGARTADGRFWFPTIRGLVSVDPNAILPRSARRAVIESVRVDGRAIDSSGVVTLPRSLNTLEIQYGGLDLAAARKLIFRYRLEDADADWVDAGARRAAYYGNLRAGRYRFGVQAFSPDGGWGPVSVALNLLVPTVFWQSWWFIAAAVAGLVATVYSLGAWRQSTRTRHEREHAEIARQLAAAILHEFRQPLQVLRARAEIQRLREHGSADHDAESDVTRALARLGSLLDRLESLHTATGLPTRRYGGDETIASLSEKDPEP